MTEGPDSLSDREREILALVATGITNQRIARDVGISVNTVKAHLRSIFGKLDVESRTEATTLAIQMGLIRVTAAGLERVPVGAQLLAGAGAASAQVVAGTEVEPVPVEWRVGRWQLLALVAAILVAVGIALWSGPRPARSGAASRFVDLPTAAVAGESESPAGRWTQRAALSAPRARFAQAALDGVIYAIAGVTEEGWTGSVERYRVADDLWEHRAEVPTPVVNIGAAVVAGSIYVPGGYNAAGHPCDLLQVYDPVADRWSTATPLPAPLFAYAIAPWGDGFYLFGGHDDSSYVDTVYHYDATADRWSLAGRLSAPRGFAAAVTVDEAIYLLGGYDGTQELALCESFHPSRAAAGGDPWRTHAAPGAPRAGHGVAAAGSNLYVVGGGWDGALLVNERYDLAHDLWSTFESPLLGEWRNLGLSAISAPDGIRLYAVGGWSGRPLNGVEVYQAEYRLYLP